MCIDVAGKIKPSVSFVLISSLEHCYRKLLRESAISLRPPLFIRRFQGHFAPHCPSLPLIRTLMTMLEKPVFPPGADAEQYARSLDEEDHLRSFRDKFIIPSKENIKTKKLEKPGTSQFSQSYYFRRLM